MTKVVFPDGTANEYTFDANSNLIASKDNNGNFTRYAYDDLDRVSSSTDAENNRTEFGYDALGNRIWLRDAKLAAAGDQRYSREWSYNGLSQLIQEKDIEGHTITYGYDVNGNVNSVQGHLSNTMTAEYDEYDRLIRYTYPIDTVNGVKRYGSFSYGYDLVGNRTSQTDPLGNITRYGYSPLGQQISATDALNSTMYYGYDNSGNRVMVRDNRGSSTQYLYDALNRLEKILYPTDQYNPVQQAISFSYDQAGNKVQRTDQKGQITQYKYDSRNRLTDILYPDGKAVHYQHDGNGNRLLMQDSTGITNYFYDKLGRLTSVTNPYRKMVAYSYDRLGNRLAMTVTDLNSQRQRTINYSYDIMNRLSTITEPGNKVTTLNYGPNLRLKEILYANGSKTSYEYNDANWLTRVITGSGTETVSKFDYTYDAAGNKSTMKDKFGVVSNYLYDPLGRLKTVTREGKNIDYTYDAVGNRIKLVNSWGTMNYTYDAHNKLRTIAEVEAANPTVTKTTNYAYDSNGNQIEEAGPKGSTYFYYDAENRLVRVKHPNSQVPDTTSSYNGDGQRVRMNDDLYNTYYLYDGANVIADTDGTGVIKSYYLRGPSGNLINTEADNKRYYYATDGLGSVTGITDETGAITQKYQYDEFGNISYEESKTDLKNPFKFTGAIHDTTANLYLMGSRYYNPKVGRFITQDSFGADYGADWTEHLYTYTDNNPVNMVDPTGHDAGVADLNAEVNYAKTYIQNNGMREFAGIGLWLAGKPEGISNLAFGQALYALNHAVLNSEQYQRDMFIIGSKADYFAAGNLGAGTLTTFRINPGGSKNLVKPFQGTSKVTTTQQLQNLATQANNLISGSGRVAGTLKHTEFAKFINGLNNPLLKTEVSFLNGKVVPYGTKGAVRVDVVEYASDGTIKAIYDLKTGSATLTPSRINQIQSQLPNSAPVIQIKP